jgi:hypothetical protein
MIEAMHMPIHLHGIRRSGGHRLQAMARPAREGWGEGRLQ